MSAPVVESPDASPETQALIRLTLDGRGDERLLRSVRALLAKGADPYWRHPSTIVGPDPRSAMDLAFSRLARAVAPGANRWMAVLDEFAAVDPARAPYLGDLTLQRSVFEMGVVELVPAWRWAVAIERMTSRLDARSAAVGASIDRYVDRDHNRQTGDPRHERERTPVEIALMASAIVSDAALVRYWAKPIMRGGLLLARGHRHADWIHKEAPAQEFNACARGAIPNLLRVVGCANYVPEPDSGRARDDVGDVRSSIHDAPARLLTRLFKRLRDAGLDLDDPAVCGLERHAALHVAVAAGCTAVACALLEAGADPDRRGRANASPAEMVGARSDLVAPIAAARAARARRMLRGRLAYAVPGGVAR